MPSSVAFAPRFCPNADIFFELQVDQPGLASFVNESPLTNPASTTTRTVIVEPSSSIDLIGLFDRGLNIRRIMCFVHGTIHIRYAVGTLQFASLSLLHLRRRDGVCSHDRKIWSTS
jgi:hypothetical protein